MSQAFHYLHITINAQSAYPKAIIQLSRYFRFKGIYILFYHNIDFCFEQNYTLIYFCQYHV